MYNFIESLMKNNAHKPYETLKFLYLFRNSKWVRYFIHAYDIPDSIFNLERQLLKSKEEFDSCVNKDVIPNQLYERVMNFCYSSDGFWSSDNVKEWAKRNTYSHPLQNTNLAKEIESFSNSIRIRNNLDTIIKVLLSECLGERYYSMEIILDKLEYADIYTDVHSVKLGLRSIFSTIPDSTNKIHIEFKRYSQGNHRKRNIIITIYGGNIDTLDITNTRRLFYGICDWGIEYEGVKRNLLYDVELQPNINNQEEIEYNNDVKHILSFYSA